MRPGTPKRIETLEAKKAQIDAELARLKARSRTESRKAETRRKILIGAVVMQEMGTRAEINAWVGKLLDQRLIKDRDRALFGLQPVSASSASGHAQ